MIKHKGQRRKIRLFRYSTVIYGFEHRIKYRYNNGGKHRFDHKIKTDYRIEDSLKNLIHGGVALHHSGKVIVGYKDQYRICKGSGNHRQFGRDGRFNALFGFFIVGGILSVSR